MSQSTKPLPVLFILIQAFKIPTQSPALYITTLFTTGFSMVLLEAIANPFIDEGLGVWTVVYLLLNGLLLTLFTITSHRLILLGEDAVPSYGILSWSKREWKFMGWTAILYIVTLAAGFMGAIPFAIFSIVLKIDSIVVLPFIFLAFLPALYFFSRISVLLPGCAIDEDMTINKVMNMTENNGWRLLLIICVIPIIFGYAFRWLTGHFWLLDVLLSMVGILVLLYEIAALSLSYQFLKNQGQEVEAVY